jgi:alcohol dehydrogenase class IV
MNFNYHNPVNLVFRAGAIDEAAERIRALGGTRALVVTGRSSAKSSGALDRLQRILTLGGVGARLFDRATPNPTTTLAVQGAEMARSEGCDVIVGLGGGSVMDAAKGLAFAINNPGDLPDYIFGRRRQTGVVPPIVLIPTTCGTGSEGNSFAVMTDPATGDKKSLRVPSIFPSVSLIDPSLMTGLPPAILGEVAFDAICHLMEAYLARNTQPLTEMMGLAGLTRSMRALRPVLDGQGSAADWADLAWASTLGGMSIAPGCVVGPHALEHPVSGRKDSISHGRGLAAICPAIYETTLSAAPKELLERFDTLGKTLGGTSRLDFLETLAAHMDRLGVTSSLSGLGLTADDLPWLTANALKVSAPGINNHPVPLDEAGIFDIYRRSL